jgi:hypothetical protein
LTTPEPVAPAVLLVAADPKDGCTAVGCGRRSTVQLHPYWDRLCPEHVVLPTVPEGPYRRDLADDMVDLGRAEAAFSYLRAWLAAEVGRRFGAVAL